MPQRLRASTAAPVVLGCCLPWLLSGCSIWNSIFHRAHDNRCTEKPFRGDWSSLPGLRVPAGLSPPEQRDQVKIPKLDEPEHVRSRNEPCLTQPPSYASGSSITLPTRDHGKMGKPAPAPEPVSPTAGAGAQLPQPAPATPQPTPATPQETR